MLSHFVTILLYLSSTPAVNRSSVEQDLISPWVKNFVSLKQSHQYCAVPTTFISDAFNRAGLPLVPFQKEALDLLVSPLALSQRNRRSEWAVSVDVSARMLYGLIHARYIVTPAGLDQMRQKYASGHFGRCPRTLCGGEQMLPVGPSDVCGVGRVQGYCPRCQDVYEIPEEEIQDGAHWGTTFPHLFLQYHSDLKQEGGKRAYTPRLFGFRLAPSLGSGGDLDRNEDPPAHAVSSNEEGQGQ